MNDRSKSVSKNASDLPPVVLIVDDDQSMRSSLENLFQSVGLDALTFSSANELTSRGLPNVVSCLVLDVRLPGLLSGLDLQAELAKAGVQIPIILMTSHGDIPMSVTAMKAGAVDFLAKPFRDQDMLNAVASALDRDRKRRQSEIAINLLRTLFESLSQRQREVMTRVTAGKMNKHIAEELGLKEMTVKIHRGHVMRKMRAKSLADLVQIAGALGIGSNNPLFVARGMRPTVA